MKNYVAASWPKYGREFLNQTAANETDYCSRVAVRHCVMLSGVGTILSDNGAMLAGISAILSIKLLALQKKSIP